MWLTESPLALGLREAVLLLRARCWEIPLATRNLTVASFIWKQRKNKRERNPELLDSRSSCLYFILLYRYWWNTRIIPFTKESYLHRTQWRYYFYLSRVKILVSPWLLTWLAKIFLFFIRILTFWNRNYKYCCLYFSFITLYPSFITFLWQAFCDRWPL